MFAIVALLASLIWNVTAVPFFYTSDGLSQNLHSHNHHTSLNFSDVKQYLDILNCRTSLEKRYFLKDDVSDIHAAMFENRHEIYVTFFNTKPLDFSILDNQPNATVPILTNLKSDAATSHDLVNTLKFFFPLVLRVVEAKFLTDKKVIIIGSQYGGSLAEVFAFQLIYGENVNVDEIWTFDSLNAGNSEFSRKLCKRIKSGYNVKNVLHPEFKSHRLLERHRYHYTSSLNQVEMRYDLNNKYYC